MGIRFFRCPSFLGVKQIVRKCFYSNISFFDAQNEGIPRSAIITDFLCCNSFFFQEFKGQLFFLDLNQKLFKYTTDLHQKIGGFVPCVIIQIVRNFWKVLSISIQLDIQTFFSRTTGLMSFVRSWLKNFTLLEEDLLRKSFVFIHVSSSWSFSFSKKAVS